jgi:pimeloyl-ACP methyl ester carboxylesterase
MRLAMDHPDLVGGLVLVAPSLSPDAQRRFFWNKPLERRALNWLVPTAWKVANTETLAQVGNLQAMLPLWGRVTAPVTLIHGTRDGMVPIEHSLFAADQLSRDTTRLDVLKGERHFILWSEVDRVSAAIREYLP